MFRFNSAAKKALKSEENQSRRLIDFLESHRFESFFIQNYLIPMGSAIWSTSREEMLEFPASTFFHFLENHGLLSVADHPQWRVVQNGSHSYIKAFCKAFLGQIKTSAGVAKLEELSEDNKVKIHFENKENQVFDRVVIATHADEALQMLASPTPIERNLLAAWTYQKNLCVLHTDRKVLPPNRRAWASWNYVRERDPARSSQGFSSCSLTYHMNRLQKLSTGEDYCVTLNRKNPIQSDRIIQEMTYYHPTYSLSAVETQPQLKKLNQDSRRRIQFCGSYFGFGFHEDAVSSSIELAKTHGIHF